MDCCVKRRARRDGGAHSLAADRGRAALPQVEDAHHLPALGSTRAFALDRSAFGGDLVAAVAQTADMQQHVLQLGHIGLIRHDEAVPLARIEPFHRAGDQNNVRRFHLVVVRQLTNPRLQSVQRL
ncbi:hypothetical protein D3C86_1659160 [compost metagenome]